MATLYLFVDSTNVIQHAQYESPVTIPSGDMLVSVSDTVANALECLANPTAYSWTGSAIVVRPAWSLAYDASTITLTLTLTNPPASPPTSVDMTLVGTTYTGTVSNNQATFSLAIHPTASVLPIWVTASATGTYNGNTWNLGGTYTAAIPLQIYTSSTGIPTVAPTSYDWVMGFYGGGINQAAQLNAITVSLGEMWQLMHAVVLPALQQSTWAAVALTANESNALSDITTNILPNIVTTLDVLYPSGGTPMPVYTQMKGIMTAVQTAVGDANTALETIPNLQ